MKKLLIATAVASTLLLAGCGGGDDPETVPEVKMPTEEEAQQKADQEELAARREKEAEEKEEATRKMTMNIHEVLSMSDLMGMSNDDSDMSKVMMLSRAGKSFEDQYPDGADPDMGPDMEGFVVGSVFSTIGTDTHKSNAINEDGKAIFVTSGSYHGVAGSYTCDPSSENGCTSMINTGGYLVLAGGTWTFEASNPEAMVSDMDIAEYGWWADKNDDNMVSEVEVFYSSETGMEGNVTGLDSFGGEATYKGDAVGKYALYRGADAVNDSGHFMADAELNATFSAEPMISGKIYNFTGADGESRNWMVTLNETPLKADGTLMPTEGSEENTTGWSISGVEADAGGEWNARMYDQPMKGTTAPSTVVGAFKAEHGNTGVMLGAFGATNQ